MASKGRGLTKLRQATACAHKDRFDSEDAARSRMRKVIVEGDAAPGSLNVYKCRVCDGYHVGHTPSHRRADP